jgi:hypothetical protein
MNEWFSERENNLSIYNFRSGFFVQPLLKHSLQSKRNFISCLVWNQRLLTKVPVKFHSEHHTALVYSNYVTLEGGEGIEE